MSTRSWRTKQGLMSYVRGEGIQWACGQTWASALIQIFSDTGNASMLMPLEECEAFCQHVLKEIAHIRGQRQRIQSHREHIDRCKAEGKDWTREPWQPPKEWFQVLSEAPKTDWGEDPTAMVNDLQCYLKDMPLRKNIWMKEKDAENQKIF